jgi:protein O-mannosyl-transferase
MRIWPRVFVVVVSITVLAALHWPTLHYPVFFDDIYYFRHNGLNNIFQAGFSLEPRWLPYFATAWIDLIFDDNVFAQRIINVGLHALTALTLYALVKQVGRHVSPDGNSERAALAAAVLFLLHPLAVYTVGYLVQRTILMATLFGLLAIGSYFDGLITRKSAYFLFSGLFYFLSAFSKEYAVLMPLAALALTPLAAPVTRELMRRLALPLALYVVIAAFVVFRYRAMVGNAYEPFAEQLINLSELAASKGELWFLSVMTQATVYFKYLLLTAIPNPDWMSIDLRSPFAENIGQIKHWAGLLALAAYGVAASLRDTRCWRHYCCSPWSFPW